ncbi:MAG: rhomboid family intramembrane serine protease [Chloroflexota bacterium]
MLNDPPPERQKPHPLEREPVRSNETPEGQAPRQQVILHIPSVRPIATYTIIVINVAIFLIRALSPRLDSQIYDWGANNATAVLANGEIYRLVSSMFLHMGIFNQFGAYALQYSAHLIFNMYALYAIGGQIERLFGHVRFTLIYLLGGLGGSVLSAALGDANAYSVGASGAVFAILAAEFVYLFQHRKLLGPRGRSQMQSLIFLAVINFSIGIVAGVGGAAVQFDNWAHFGGLLGGLALTWMIGPIFIVRRHPEHANELLGEDINPLKNRYWVLSVYVVALMVILFVARSFT